MFKHPGGIWVYDSYDRKGYMNDKFFRFLEKFHKFLKIIGYIVSLGGFLLIVVAATISQGFPNGFLGGLVFGSIFALLSWLGFRLDYKRAVEARKKLQAYYQGQTDVFAQSKQATYVIIGIVAVSGLVLFLLAAREISSGGINNIITIMILFLIGAVIASETLFRQGKEKRRAATLSLISLAAIVILLVVKVLFYR
jgi:hypothetical protein